MDDYEGARYVEVDSEQAGTPEYVAWLEAKLERMRQENERLRTQAGHGIYSRPKD